VRRVVFSSSSDLTRASRGSASGHFFVSYLTAAAESLFSVLFPSNCRFCQAPLRKASRLPVCEECLSNVRSHEGPVCQGCGERLLSRYLLDGEGLCGMCRRIHPLFARALAYGSYDGGLRELIHLLKYQQVRPAASVLGRMLAEVVEELAKGFAGETPLVIPVPLHAAKLRQRGFNQSELIARAAAKLKPAGLEWKVNPTVLVRQRPTASQTGLTPHQRRENMRGAFVVARPEEVAGRDFLLVDDVLTTGTTVSECARVLRRAGAERVWVATVARVLKAEAAHALAPQAEGEERAPLKMAVHA
jgi:ComF family protein